MRHSDNPAPVRIMHQNLPLIFSAQAFLLPILKEPGYSSGFFVNQVRRRLSSARKIKRFKIGHAGTLDPFATGVLLLLGGGATKLQDTFMTMPKTYEATIRLGATSPSLDPDTEVTPHEPYAPNIAELQRVLAGFCGEIEQIPPAWSAKHVDGKRAYALARAGREVVLDPVRVRVDELVLLGVEGADVRVRVTSGSGFYVRALARDVAAALGTVGYLTQLARVHASGFALEECLTLREVLDGNSAPARRQEP